VEKDKDLVKQIHELTDEHRRSGYRMIHFFSVSRRKKSQPEKSPSKVERRRITGPDKREEKVNQVKTDGRHIIVIWNKLWGHPSCLKTVPTIGNLR
jgi:hypothetical protein